MEIKYKHILDVKNKPWERFGYSYALKSHMHNVSGQVTIWSGKYVRQLLQFFFKTSIKFRPKVIGLKVQSSSGWKFKSGSERKYKPFQNLIGFHILFDNHKMPYFQKVFLQIRFAALYHTCSFFTLFKRPLTPATSF